MKVIVVTGSVCSGKTTLARALARELGYGYLDVNKVIEDKGLVEGFDEEKLCKIVDVDKLTKELEMIVKSGNFVVDSHMSHFLDKDIVNLCIVVKCELGVIKERLEKRGYSNNKVKGNLEAEIFETCLIEAKELGHKVMTVNTTHDFNIKKVLEMIKNGD